MTILTTGQVNTPEKRPLVIQQRDRSSVRHGFKVQIYRLLNFDMLYIYAVQGVASYQ